MKRRCIVLLLVLLVICCLHGCKIADATTAPNQTEPSSTTQETVPTTNNNTTPSTPAPTDPDISVVLNPDFSGMPSIYADFVDVYRSGNIAIFAFYTAGMDAANTTVVTYDLAQNVVLGQLDLGEDMINLFALEDGGFSVLSYSTNSYRVFDTACMLLSETALDGINGEIGFAGLQGDTLLLSQLSTGAVYLYSLSNRTYIETDLAPDVYTYIGAYNGHFLVESYEKGLISIAMDGSTHILFKNGSAQVVGSTYAAGIRGDYITMLPLLGGDAFMAPCQSMGEIFVAADGVGLLSRTQNWDGPNSLYYYTTDSMTVATIAVEGMVVGAGLSDGCAVVVTRMDYSQPLQFRFVDLAQYEQVDIAKSAYDNGTINGADPLPEPSGSTQTVELINRLQRTYGIRLMYEPDFFDLESLGYTLKCTDETTFRERALLLESFFAFLPDGLLKEMGEDVPVVIYLCQEVYPTAGGLHTFLNGYNVVFLTVTGNDDYFLHVAAHEMGHALELGMAPEVVAGWRELMPADVRKAYEMLSLTVEYTPDDKGRTPVWFLDAYSRTSEKEDRAVLFATLFDAWRTDDYSRFQYDGLKQKANFWSVMLRQTYESCKDVTFPWDTALAD